MSHQFVVYIDEAGDAGFGKLREPGGPGGQSRWFAVGACVVSRANDVQLPRWRDEIVSRLPSNQRRDIHFRHLRHHDAKVFVSNALGQRPIGVAVALSNKITLLDMGARQIEKFKQPDHLQNYLTRYLLERVSFCIKVRASKMQLSSARAKLVFSQRGHMNYDGFRDYLRLIRGGRERQWSPGKIDWDVLDPDLVDVQSHERLAGLQFADVATSAFWRAIEPNQFGLYEHRYANELRSRVLVDSKGVAFGTGVVHVPKLTRQPAPPLDDQQSAFFASWKKARQTPGP